jgi:hypothetical protein
MPQLNAYPRAHDIALMLMPFGVRWQNEQC